MKKALACASLLLLAACTASRFPAPTQADADRVATKFPGVSLNQLTTGKANYEQYCGSCHKLEAPGNYTEEAWHKIVPKMAVKAKIDEATEQNILRYLVTMCAPASN